jgi:hypothetical protein
MALPRTKIDVNWITFQFDGSAAYRTSLPVPGPIYQLQEHSKQQGCIFWLPGVEVALPFTEAAWLDKGEVCQI